MQAADDFWRGSVVRALVDTGDLGQVIRLARERRGWRQIDLGRAAGYSAATISRLEGGRCATVDAQKARAIATVIGMPSEILAALLGLRRPPKTTVVTRVAHAPGEDDPMRRRTLLAAGLAVPAAILSGLDDALAVTPEPAGPVTPAQVAGRLRNGWRLFESGNLVDLTRGLPDLLAAAHRVTDRADEPEAWTLLAACYELATEGLHKVDAPQQARITADRATLFAARSHDPVAMAGAARVMGIVLRHEGRQSVAQQVTMQAVERLDRTGLTTPAQTSSYALMLCTTAYNAAVADRRADALEMISGAQQAARRLGPGPVGPRTVAGFRASGMISPAQVTLYEVSVRWGLGDPGAALDIGERLHPDQFPTRERKARLHTDMARAFTDRGRPDSAIGQLLDAYQHAPSEVRDRPSIRRLAVQLVRDNPRSASARQLARAL